MATTDTSAAGASVAARRLARRRTGPAPTPGAVAEAGPSKRRVPLDQPVRDAVDVVYPFDVDAARRADFPSQRRTLDQRTERVDERRLRRRDDREPGPVALLRAVDELRLQVRHDGLAE